MGNMFAVRVQQMTMPENVPAQPENKSQELPANRPNTAKYMPGDKTAKMAKQGKPKTLPNPWKKRKKRAVSR